MAHIVVFQVHGEEKSWLVARVSIVRRWWFTKASALKRQASKPLASFLGGEARSHLLHFEGAKREAPKPLASFLGGEARSHLLHF